MAIDLTLARLLVPVIGDTDQLESSLGRAQKLTQSFGKNVQALGSGALKVMAGGAAAATGAVAGLVAGLGKLAIDTAPLKSVEDAFNGIADAAGMGGDKMLAALQKASGGMITNRDLMLSFNKASQLVSKDFATQLPDAMSSLGKVAASTGQDLNYLLDSLVTGVGRVSPMILDNLGVQVDLNAALEDFAAANGLAADSLTKTQQQEALMAQVVKKLAENTADMPDITETAAAKMERFKTTLKNTKDQIGMSLVPALGTLLDTFAPLIEQAVPFLVDLFETRVAPAVDLVAETIGGLVLVVQDMATGVFGRDYPWEDVLPAELVDIAYDVSAAVFDVIDKARELAKTIAPYVEAAADWIGKTFELRDVLIALAIAIGAVVIPAIAGIVTAAAPILAVALALIGAVALVRKIWEEDFLGIRSAIEDFVGRVVEVFEDVQAAVQPFVDAIAGIVGKISKAFKGGGWQAALETFKAEWPKLKQAVLGGLEAAAGVVGPILEEIGATLLEAGRNLGLQLVEGLGSVLGVDLFEKFNEVRDTVTGVFDGVVEALTPAWEMIEAVITSAIDIIWPAIQTFVENAREGLGAFEPMLEKLRGLWESLQPVVEVVMTAIGAVVLAGVAIVVGAFEGLANAIGPLIEGIAGILGGLVTTFTGIVDVVVGLVELIWAAIQGDPEAIAEAWEKIKGGVIQIVEGLIEGITSAFGGLWGAVSGFVKGFVDGVIEFATSLYDKLVGNSIIPDLIDDVVDYFKGLPKRAAEAITAGLGKILAAGKAIVDGLKQGVEEAWDSFKSWIKSKIEEMVKGVLEALGIGSPSKVFRAIGRILPPSMSIGWGETWDATVRNIRADLRGLGRLSAGVPSVSARVPGLAQVARGPAPMGGMGGGEGGRLGGDTFVNHFHNQGAAALFLAEMRGRRRRRLDATMTMGA